MIIYIHGFGGSGEGSKAKLFRDYFDSIDEGFIAPSLSFVPDLAIKTLEELIESYKEDVFLIGSSLGGYYTIYLADKYKLKAVLLNPSINPLKTLSRAIGDAPNFYDNSSFKWSVLHTNMLKAYEVKTINKHLYTLLTQKGDKLLDYKEAVNKLKGCRQIVENGGSHSFDKVEKYFKTIKNIFIKQNINNELFSMKNYKDTLAFALKAHKNQETPEGLPYSFHIVSVATEIINALHVEGISYEDANIAISCALLHDVNEDTDVVVDEKLDIQNIQTVMAGVMALTKNETLKSKKDQMNDSLNRLLKQAHCVQMVKLADRITNLAPPPVFWNKAKRESYRNEAIMILNALYKSSNFLAKKLKEKIQNYSEYITEDKYIIFHTDKVKLVLDQSHPKYLTTFKAINRLNSYLKKEYDLELFTNSLHVENPDSFNNHEKVDMSYIVKVLNTKELLNLNKQTDDKIAKYISILYEVL